MKVVLTSAGGATILPSVKAELYVLEPMENFSGLMINERKVNYLKTLWIRKPTVNRENYGYGGNGEGQFVKIGMVVTMNISLSQVSNAPVTVRRYIFLGVDKKHYNK